MNKSTVVSKPNAAIRVEVMNLTDEEIAGLTINGRLSDINLTPSTDNFNIYLILALYGIVIVLFIVSLVLTFS